MSKKIRQGIRTLRARGLEPELIVIDENKKINKDMQKATDIKTGKPLILLEGIAIKRAYKVSNGIMIIYEEEDYQLEDDKHYCD